MPRKRKSRKKRVPKKPGPVTICGKPFECLVCGHDQFTDRLVILANAAATLVGLAWTGPQARCYICAECGYVHPFLVNREDRK